MLFRYFCQKQLLQLFIHKSIFTRSVKLIAKFSEFIERSIQGKKEFFLRVLF